MEIISSNNEGMLSVITENRYADKRQIYNKKKLGGDNI